MNKMHLIKRLGQKSGELKNIRAHHEVSRPELQCWNPVVQGQGTDGLQGKGKDRERDLQEAASLLSDTDAEEGTPFFFVW
jgi:hypothetical protein